MNRKENGINNEFDFSGFILRILRKITSLPVWIWILIPVIGVGIVAIAFSYLTIGAILHNSTKDIVKETQMQSVFNEKKTVFQKIIKMLNEDPKVIQITDNYVEFLNNGETHFIKKEEKHIAFSQERWMEYKYLFNEIGLKVGVRRLEKDDNKYPQGIYLRYDIKGMLGGITKGFVHTTRQIDNELIVDSIDKVIEDIGDSKPGRIVYYQPIEQNWYMFVESY